jgi:hypothetical protein
LAAAGAYTDLLYEENIIHTLKNITKVVLKNRRKTIGA